MPIPVRSGVVWYVAPPEWGKTTRALKDAASLIRTTKRPLLVIDSQGVRQFARMKHYTNVADVCHAVWDRGENAAIMPTNAEDVDALCEAARAAGDVIVLVDESAFWLGRRAYSAPMLRLMRAHQHARAHVLLTTQHFSGDVPQEALACSPVIFTGPIKSPAALQVLSQWYAVDVEALARLPQYEFLEIGLQSRNSLVKAGSGSGGDAPVEPASPPTTSAGAPPSG